MENQNPFGLSPGWWFLIGGVITSILVNIASSYFRERIDRFLSKISTRWATRTAKLKVETEATIRYLSENDIRLLVYINDELGDRINALLTGMFSAFCIACGFALGSLASKTELGFVAQYYMVSVIVMRIVVFLLTIALLVINMRVITKAARKRFIIHQVVLRKEPKNPDNLTLLDANIHSKSRRKKPPEGG